MRNKHSSICPPTATAPPFFFCSRIHKPIAPSGDANLKYRFRKPNKHSSLCTPNLTTGSTFLTTGSVFAGSILVHSSGGP